MPDVVARTLTEICADALRATCGECWSAPGQPCATPRPGGVHVARLGRAMRRGLVTGPDLIAVLETLDAFTAASVVYGEAEAAA